MFVFVLTFLHMFWLMYTKQERFFGWIIILWHVSGLLYLYGHRLMDLLPYQHYQILILSEFLFIVYIIPLIYVGYKFKEKFKFMKGILNWRKKRLFITFLEKHLYISIVSLMILGIVLSLLVFFPFIIIRTIPFSFSFLFFLFLFSIINGFLEEWLWRGILLSAMLKMTNKVSAILFSSVAFGASQIIYGFSLKICLFYIAGGILLGWITIKSESFIIAAIWHSVLNMLLILSGFIPFYEQ